MTSAKQWWKRAAAAVKDKRSVCLAKVPVPRRRAPRRNPEMEVAVIRATSHDERAVDYKNAARVFRWARTSPPTFLPPLMRAIVGRATRTGSWPVALKSLLLVHGLQLLDPPSADAGPFGFGFDLSEFRDRHSRGFSAFVRAYFQFLNQRTILLSDDDGCGLESVEKLQTLLDLLMQIRPCGDGMGVGLVLEALDCVVIEMFNVCGAIAALLVGVPGLEEGCEKRGGAKGVRILRKAAEQSAELSDYFEMCRSLGVLNAAELPLPLPMVEGISEEDMMDLERRVEEEVEEELGWSETVVTKDWIVFDDDEFTEAKYASP